MASRRPPDFRTLASLSRVNLLYALLQRGSLTVEELAETAGLHSNTAREHLHRLIDAGFVSAQAQPRDSRGRPKILYALATDRNDPVQAKRIRDAAERADQVRRLVSEPDSSHTPSPMERQIDMVDDHMDRCGFDATVDTDSLRVKVHVCPFERLARQHPEVCQVHYRLVDEALHDVDGPLETKKLHRLDPIDGCSIDLKCHLTGTMQPA